MPSLPPRSLASRIICSEKSKATTRAPPRARRRDVSPLPQAMSSTVSPCRIWSSVSTRGQIRTLNQSLPSAIRESQKRAFVFQASRTLSFWSATFRDLVAEDLVERQAVYPRDAEGDFQRRRVFAELDGIHGLPGDTDPVGELLLRHLLAIE